MPSIKSSELHFPPISRTSVARSYVRISVSTTRLCTPLSPLPPCSSLEGIKPLLRVLPDGTPLVRGVDVHGVGAHAPARLEDQRRGDVDAQVRRDNRARGAECADGVLRRGVDGLRGVRSYAEEDVDAIIDNQLHRARHAGIRDRKSVV